MPDSPIETRDADFALHVAGKPRKRLCGGHAVQPLSPGQIKEGLVDRQRLNLRRQVEHHAAHLAADADVFVHVGPDHCRMGTEPQGLEHRHGRSDPESASDVAGRGHHAALATADDHWLGRKRRIVAFFDGGVKGVAIDMGDGKAVEFGMAQQAGRAARLAAA